MIGAILGRELRSYRRNKQFRIVFVILALLCAVASVDGWKRAQEVTRTRIAAQESDRENWVKQGANNPHGAAHVSRYAFRSTPELAAFEPGILDYAGAAVWMEAHHQNPATLRRAEDSLGRAPVAALSLAWITRTLGSLALVVLLFRSVAQERESKTLRAVAAAGVKRQSFVLGKISAALVATIGLTVVALSVSLIPGFFLSSGELDFLRLFAIFLTTALGLGCFSMMVVAVSAKSSTSGVAMIASAVLWLFWCVGLPALTAQLATSLHPDPDEHVFKTSIQKEAQSDFWSGGGKDKALAAYKQKVVQRSGAKTFEDLKLNMRGVTLQAHEEHANEVYDRRYGELSATHRAQDRLVSVASALSPLLALQRITAGLAGTDLLAQQRFAVQAEAHRRQIIAQLNQDLMENAGDLGMKYEAGRDLWEKIPDFVAHPPSFTEVLRHYRLEFAALIAWGMLASLLAFRFAGGAMKTEERIS